VTWVAGSFHRASGSAFGSRSARCASKSCQFVRTLFMVANQTRSSSVGSFPCNDCWTYFTIESGVWSPQFRPGSTQMSILVRPLALFVCLLVSPAFLSAQKQATVIHNASLRADTSTHNPPIQTVTQGTHVFVIDAKPTNGFYHVRTGQQKQGWVWSKSVGFQPRGGGSSRELVRRPTVVETEKLMGSAAAGRATDLNSCPASGCAGPDDATAGGPAGLK